MILLILLDLLGVMVCGRVKIRNLNQMVKWSTRLIREPLNPDHTKRLWSVAGTIMKDNVQFEEEGMKYHPVKTKQYKNFFVQQPSVKLISHSSAGLIT